MALNWVFSVSLEDENGVRRPTAIGFVPTADTITLTQLKAAWKTWALTIDGVSDARVVGGNVSLNYNLGLITALGGFKADNGDEEVVEGVVFDYNVTGTNKVFGQYIPGFSDSHMDGAKIDLTDSAVVAMTGLALDGIEDVGNFSDEKGLDLGALRVAFQATRKNRKQLKDRSRTLPG